MADFFSISKLPKLCHILTRRQNTNLEKVVNSKPAHKLPRTVGKNFVASFLKSLFCETLRFGGEFDLRYANSCPVLLFQVKEYFNLNEFLCVPLTINNVEVSSVEFWRLA